MSTNPYLLQLVQSLRPLVDVRCFSWRVALGGRYDVLHIHWPEVLLRGSTFPRTWAKRFLFALLLLRLRLSRIAIVRTLHNVDPHETGPWAERILLAACDRQTALWIRLNPTTRPPIADRPISTILHGDYREWFARHPRPASVPGRLLSFGLLREYKGVDLLADVFGDVTAPGSTLHVAGSPASPEFADQLRTIAARDRRITLALGYVSDADLAHEVGEAELVVLPYREMHNSGAILLALSLARPVLVPSTPVTEMLREEVGDCWVHTYEGTISDLAIRAACAEVRNHSAMVLPDLTLRNWPDIARQHREAYVDAVRAQRDR